MLEQTCIKNIKKHIEMTVVEWITATAVKYGYYKQTYKGSLRVDTVQKQAQKDGHVECFNGQQLKQTKEADREDPEIRLYEIR